LVQVEALTKQPFEEYMQHKIMQPLGAHSTTYHPDKHFGETKWPLLMQEMAQRENDGSYTKAAFPWHTNPQICAGGIGLFTTASDYAKILSAIMAGGGPILSRSSVEELLKPQELCDEAVESLQDFVFERPYGLDRHVRTSEGPSASQPLVLQSLAGTVTTEDIAGRRRKGTVNWGGNPSIIWWIDRESGIAAALFTQLRPARNWLDWPMSLEIENAAYRLLEIKKI
jgi:CubicO group peptidase (beta-lactamase class C family)